MREDFLDVFEKEYKVRDHARSLSNDPPKDFEALHAEYRELSEAFGKLLKNSTTQTKTSDSMQRKLVRLRLQLEKRNQEILDAQEALILREKMVSLGALTTGLAHAINTPLGISVTAATHTSECLGKIKTAFETGALTKDGFERFITQSERGLEVLVSNLAKASQLVSSFKSVTGDNHSDRLHEIEVKEYLNDVAISLSPQLKSVGAECQVSGPEHLSWSTNSSLLFQVLSQLIMNAVNHAFVAPEQGNWVRLTYGQEDNNIVFEVADNGVGIAPKDAKRVFDPFFTTQRAKGFTGLGLHVVYNMVHHKFHGSISCESEPGLGTTFTLKLPLMSSQES